jgi:hypothetical protein
VHPDWLQALVRDAHIRDASVSGPSWKLEVEL